MIINKHYLLLVFGFFDVFKIIGKVECQTKSEEFMSKLFLYLNTNTKHHFYCNFFLEHFDDSFSLIKKYFVWQIKVFIHPTRVQFFCTAFTNFTNFLKINDNSIWNISKSLKKEKNSYTANRIFSFLQLDILYVISRWYCTTHNCILFKNPFSKERSRECAVIVVVWVKKLSTQL